MAGHEPITFDVWWEDQKLQGFINTSAEFQEYSKLLAMRAWNAALNQCKHESNCWKCTGEIL
jgi:hypothetical protein